jgi:TolA-binding protein
MHRPNRKYRILLIALVALSSFLAASSSDSNATSDTKGNEETLAELGVQLESVRLLDEARRLRAVAKIDSVVLTLLHGDLPSEKKSAAYFLSAEIKYLRSDFAVAAELFEKAKKEDKNGSFADDAAFLEIVAMEADGRDEEATKRWKKWIKKNEKSPLMPEALLAASCNAIRRGALGDAAANLSDLDSRYPYLRDDHRVRQAAATISFLEGNADRAIEQLGDQHGSAADHFLRGLCYETKGQMLKAAAHFQNVYERYVESPLCDQARLAKANIFMTSSAFKSAVEEFASVIEHSSTATVTAEARLRMAACQFLDDDAETATEQLREVTQSYKGQDFAARAQMLLGEVLVARGMHEEAILEFNRVLTDYFEHELAAIAQYRVGRCLDALGRPDEATSAYQMVVSGYPISPQSPAAAYLAGAGLLEQGRPRQAVPYFQLVLDRYAQDTGTGELVFASPEHQELVEAALCLLELSYHRVGDLGQLSGVPHLMLQKMPPSSSSWRAFALLIDADALASQGRHEEAQTVLQTLIDEFPGHEVELPANRLLAWSYAQLGHDDLAIQVEEQMLARHSQGTGAEQLSSAYLNKAHILFNNKNYKDAAVSYDDFYQRYPSHPQRLLALYQAGLCYYRLQQKGDAIDRWEQIVKLDPAAEISERAWVRAGDLYFQTEYYDDAKRSYQGLLEHFENSKGAALGMLRLAQCEFNAGNDKAALELFSAVTARFPGTGIAREAQRGIETALYRLGQGEDGSEVLAELVEQYPDGPFAADAQFEVARRLYEGKEYAEAADEFRRVVSQFPDYSAADRAHFLMAESYAQAGSPAEAKKAYAQFLIFFPDSEFQLSVRFKLGALRFADGDYMQAAVDFETVIENGESAELSRAALFNLALCKKMMGVIEDAADALARYREKYPDDERASQVAYQLGDINETRGDLGLAADEYEKALRSGPTADLKLELHFRVGVCYEELNDIDKAVAAYEKAIASKIHTDTFRLSAVIRCAALYEQKGEHKKAMKAYQDIVKNADDPELVVAAQERVSQLKSVVE